MIHGDRGRKSMRIVLSGADVVLPDQILSPGTVVLEGGRIAEIAPGSRPGGDAPGHVDCAGLLIVPGFIDVHVHGIEGSDALDGAGAIAHIAGRLAHYGVTAFCPTSIACAPATLRVLLSEVRASRQLTSGARVLPAHLESNFINPDYRGAQPLDCLRLPAGRPPDGTFAGTEILDEIRAAQGEVGIMTVAPEIEGALDLIHDLVARGIHVSLGHSGATYDQARQGIDAGARQATHLFNRMPPLGHRAPGLAAAILESDEVSAEIICDGVHVHPAMLRLALAIKGASKIMAITDGTAGSGLSRGARASLGGRAITVRDAAYLDDGTLAGSVLTMDRAFATLVRTMNLSPVDAALACSTTPAGALGLDSIGRIAEGCAGDLVLLDRDFRVMSTYIAGELAWAIGQ
jgi:N-acetylglucosamine-6-phosphate deacetylase